MTPQAGRRSAAARALTALEAAALLVVSSIAIPLLGSARTTRLLGVPSAPKAVPKVRAPEEALHVGGIVEKVAALLPWRPSCLRQALAVRWMLHRRGIACQCHLGVVSVAPFSAHAWVTVDGAVVVGGPVTNMTRLSTFT